MLHTYVHWWLCVAIQYDDITLIINPTLNNLQQKQRLDSHPGAFSIYSPDIIDINTIPRIFAVLQIDTSLVITVAWLSLLYYHRDTSLSKVAWLSDLDLLLVDFSIGIDMACQLAWSVTAKTVVPINLNNTDDPVWFCREVMLHHCGVPKYLKNGQYVVHDVII